MKRVANATLFYHIRKRLLAVGLAYAHPCACRRQASLLRITYPLTCRWQASLLRITYPLTCRWQAIKQIISKWLLKASFQDHLEIICLSLLSDSNQRPRDYKSRALAN